MQELSNYQKKVLLNNSNVEKILEKNVIFTSNFKISAVEKFLKGMKPDHIFEEAQINLSFFARDYARFCLKRWKKKYFDEGRDSLKISQTGKQATGRPKSINTDEMTMEELKAIVEIQNEVIAMLKKNRALTKKKKEN